jgi:predicted nucleotidyltransferase
MKTAKEQVKGIFEAYPEIKLVYFFGSKARGDGGPLSDYDFAIYFDGINKNQMFDVKFELADKLSRALKIDKVDVVVLNLTESPELKYNIIKDGEVILEQEPHRVIVEPRILNEYFDFRQILLRYQLTNP